MVSYIIGFVCSFVLAAVVSFFWVRGINHMKENHPDYEGKDFLNNEDEDSDVDYLG
jgi:hypothetical protein